MPSSSERTGLFGGIVSGIVAYGLGYLLTYVLSIDTIRESGLARLIEAFGTEGVAWKMVGWVFYNAHGATTTVEVDVLIFQNSSTMNLIAQSDALSPVLYVVPPALLIIGGLATARMAGSTELSDAFRIGPAITLGYLVLVLIGIALFTITVGDSVGKPTLVPTIGLAGIVYPVVFGTAGAALGITLDGTDGR